MSTRSRRTVPTGLVVPQLTEEDPEVAGEGSLDPLGLGVLAERLGDQLLPGITNRMRRPRMMTAMVVGALAADGLAESVPAGDGRSTPSICFEWLLLVAFVRRAGAVQHDDLVGVPGPGKVRVALDRGDPVTFGNYLKTPGVFGFTGVLYPLALRRGLLDAARGPGERARDLASVWEREHDFPGFADDERGTKGGTLRGRIRAEVERALQSGQCQVSSTSHLLGDLASSLNPSRPGSGERRLLRSVICDPDDGFVGELARVLRPHPSGTPDQELLELVRPQASAPLRDRLDAVVAYEAVATRLEAVFTQWQWQSTLAGTSPVGAAAVGDSSVVRRAASTLAASIDRARRAIDVVDSGLATAFDGVANSLELAAGPVELARDVMLRHEQVQAGKPPRGKRPWFEAAGDDAGGSWILRPTYRLDAEPTGSFEHFNRPYRLASLNNMLQELR